jgi:hypothetical protein
MKRAFAALFALLAAVALVALALSRLHTSEPEVTAAPEPPTSPEIVNAVTLEADHKIGAGRSFEGLTVFPVLADDQPDLGRFVTLEQALADKTAEVRETDENGRVNSLVIVNKGDKSIFVLAGTVVKGGKQDRQIAQDFAVAPGQTTPVEAFCVEPHRWNASRDGVATHNRFGASKTLATSSVRAAGQYKKDQGEVWSKVGEVNAQNGKRSSTGSLAASLDDQEIAAKRSDLARRVSTFVDGLLPQQKVVGIAYAVDGKVRSVRWFANHELYAMYRESLFNTAALEAITAARAARGKPMPPAPPLPPEAVKAFVDEIATAEVAEERPTSGETVNAYKETKRGYGSSSTLKKAPAGSAKRGRKATLSSDFTAK